MAHRVQIWMTDAQYEVLNAEANRTGVSMAELVRRLIDRAWRPGARPRVSGFELSMGIWKRPDAAVAGRRPGIKLDDEPTHRSLSEKSWDHVEGRPLPSVVRIQPARRVGGSQSTSAPRVMRSPSSRSSGTTPSRHTFKRLRVSS